MKTTVDAEDSVEEGGSGFSATLDSGVGVVALNICRRGRLLCAAPPLPLLPPVPADPRRERALIFRSGVFPLPPLLSNILIMFRTDPLP